uniref:Uncharacterized protein n=1 Tax=Lotharella globosa TaxID=91324 RepID=A0A7S3ZDX6_9EUKA
MTTMISECLQPLHPTVLRVQDATNPAALRPQMHLIFHIVSDNFTDKNVMTRHNMVDNLLTPVYDQGVMYIEGYYQAPGEEDQLVPVVERSNVSRMVHLSMDVTELPWQYFPSPPLEAPVEEVDEDEAVLDDEPFSSLPGEKLKDLHWFDDAYLQTERPPQPQTQNKEFYLLRALQNRTESDQRDAEARGSGEWMLRNDDDQQNKK